MNNATRQPTRRNVELVLILAAWCIGLLGALQVGWATGETAGNGLWLMATVVGVLALAMHVVVRARAPYADPVILPVATLLTLFGLVMIYRLDVAFASRAELNGNPAPTPLVYSQLTWFTVAGILFVATLFLLRDHRTLQRYTYTLGLVGLVLIILPLVPGIGKTINGATLWIQLGGFSFQPAEMAKILLTVFFAGYLVEKRDALALVRTKVIGIGLPRVKDLGPIVIAWLISLGVLVFETDLGTSLLFFGLFVTMLYIATQRRSWLVLGGLLFAAGAVAAFFMFAHVRLRVDIWLHPWDGDKCLNDAYQICQSLFGLGNGGILGAGLGQGYPDLVPFPSTDFIVAALGEELGVTGLMAIIVLYAILIERGLRTAISVRDPFGQLLAAGLSITLALQVFVIIGGVTKLIPLTGLTTPFLSYGGSSLIANWIIVALLLRISDRARRPEPAAAAPDEALTQVVRRVS